MAGNNISRAVVTGDEIIPTIIKIEDALQETPRAHAIMACLAVVLLLQCPNLDPEQLTTGVHEVSKFICAYIDNVMEGSEYDLDIEEDSDLPPNLIN